MSEDTRFQEAVEALRLGDKARAKDLLTALIQDEQTNPVYWIWMSAVVETPKERIYCLQTALKLDPGNATAKRGLVLLGALPPDETVRPFSLNRPRAWEQNLLLAHELPKQKQAWTSSPLARLSGLGLAGVLLCGLVVAAFLLRQQISLRPRATITPGPSPTYSPTPTLIGEAGAPTPTFIGPTPLWAFLKATYTPTPFYVSTPRQPQSGDQFRVARDAFKKSDWETFIRQMRDIARLEPEAVDIPYLIGEAYRFQGNAAEALVSYNDALQINSRFGPAYLGLARARLMQDPNADVTDLFTAALDYDPNFGEVYLERSDYYLYHEDARAALEDLVSAGELMPDSPLVYYGRARAHQMLKDIPEALENAELAQEMDITMLPNYLLRGALYIESEQYPQAIEALTIYTNYEPEDGRAFALLGECYYRRQDYKPAIELFTKAIRLDSSQRQVYLHRAFAYLETGEPGKAQTDFDRAIPFSGETFEIKLGRVRAYYDQEKFGSAYLQAEGAFSLAATDEEEALALFWRALSNEGRGEIRDAVEDWQALLKLPPSAMTEEMRRTAEEHLRTIALITPSPTPRPVTPTRTRTPVPVTPTKTPTRTPSS